MSSLKKKAEYARKYYIAHRDLIIKRSAAHHKANKGRCSERQRQHYRKIAKWRDGPVGWTKALYFEKVSMQKRRCAICQKYMRRPVRDHDHVTGLARGLLCDPCNRMLGTAKDNPQTLINGAKYLRRKYGKGIARNETEEDSSKAG